MIQPCKVAEHPFSFEIPEIPGLERLLEKYRPFASGEKPAFTLRCHLGDRIPDKKGTQLTSSPSGIEVSIAPTQDAPAVAGLHLSAHFSSGILSLPPFSEETVAVYQFALDTALMIQYALFTASCQTLLLHASVVTDGEAAYAFLGKSGTGKSTHSRLWLDTIPGMELLNDDNPIVRLHPSGVKIYGSPWSGKTPCYRPLSYPLKALVRLRQAPVNRISTLDEIEAYLAVSSAVSAFHTDGLKKTSLLLHEAVASLIREVAVYRLDCLPNTEAAQLCYSHITGSGK